MSKTLNLIDHLFTSGRHFLGLGHLTRARLIFEHLSRLENLSPTDFQEVHEHLADIAWRQGDFQRASRHQVTLGSLDPQDAKHHHRLGKSLVQEGKRDEALEQMRQAVQLDPKHAEYHADLGQLALDLDLDAEATAALRRAAELAPNEFAVVRTTSLSLVEAGLGDEARRFVRAAQFRNSRDRRFHDLWYDVQYQITHRQIKQPGRTILSFEIDGQQFRLDRSHARKGPTRRPSIGQPKG